MLSRLTIFKHGSYSFYQPLFHLHRPFSFSLCFAFLFSFSEYFFFVSASFADEGEAIQTNLLQPLSSAPESIQLPSDIPPLPGPREQDSRYFISKKNVLLFHNLLLAPLATWIRDGTLMIKVIREVDFTWQLNQDWTVQTKANLSRADLDAHHNLIIHEGGSTAGFPFGFAADINKEPDLIRKAYKILWNSSYAEMSAQDVLYDLEMNWIGSHSVVMGNSGVFYRRAFYQPHFEKAPQQKKLKQPSGETEKSIHSKVQATASIDSSESSISVDISEEKNNEQDPVIRAHQYSLAGDIVRQEILQFLAPPVVFGFAQITWRYRGQGEDEVWIYSPVIGQSRKVFESNRSDPLLGGVLTADDFFVWSTKVQAVNAKVVGEKVLLLPFTSLNLYQAQFEEAAHQNVVATDLMPDPKAADTGERESAGKEIAREHSQPQSPEREDVLSVRGSYQRSDASSATIQWNYETKEFPDAAPWVPTTLSFVPRKVWILEVTPRDPFYLAGRQIIVVDQDSMLPFYKLVYSRRGDYKKTVIGSWALGSSADAKFRFPFCTFLLAVEQGTQRVNTLTTRTVQTFFGKDSTAALDIRKLLDISMHIRRAEQDSKTNPGESRETPPTQQSESLPSQESNSARKESDAGSF